MSTATTSQLAPLAPRGATEDVWSYPRPPLLQRTPNRLQVVYYPASGSPPITIADTSSGYRVCETSHPPTYYLPPESVQPGVRVTKTGKESYCEWKGKASYWSVAISNGNGDGEGEGGNDTAKTVIKDRVWSYEKPTAGFAEIKGYLSFYASSSAQASRGKSQGIGGGWKCFVDGEEVGVQEG